MNTKRNIPYITLLQAFAFLCVVLGHALSLYSRTGWYRHWHYVPTLHHINQVIYNFHMPLFFFLSGFLLFKTTQGIFSWFAYNKKRFNRLIITYYLAGIFYCIPAKAYINPLKSGQPLEEMSYLFLTLKYPDYLWFLISLFFTSLAFTTFIKTPLRKYPWLLIILFIIFNQFPQYLGLHEMFVRKVMINLIYFYLGYLCAQHLDTIIKYINIKSICLLLIAAFISFCTYYRNLSAALFILFFFALFYNLSQHYSKLSEIKIIRFISDNMLLLYIFHEPIMIGTLKAMNYGYSANPYLMALFLFSFDLIISLNLVYIYRQIKSK